jgi:ssDNA-binding replication factor A large subunit
LQVISEELVQGKRAMLRCTLGDDTGLVRAFLPDEPALRVGKSVVLFDCEARVVKEHIEVQLGRNGRIDVARKEVDRVNEKFNLSDKSWVPVQ